MYFCVKFLHWTYFYAILTGFLYRLRSQLCSPCRSPRKGTRKSRALSKEQENIATMEKQVASKNNIETLAPKEMPKSIRISPRRLNAQQKAAPKHADQDVDTTDAASVMPPPSVPRLLEVEVWEKRRLKSYTKTKQVLMLGSRLNQIHVFFGTKTSLMPKSPPISCYSCVQVTNFLFSSESHRPVLYSILANYSICFVV